MLKVYVHVKKVTFVLQNFESWTFLKTELIHLCAGIKSLNLLTYHDLCILLVLINGNHFQNEQTAINSPCEQTCVLGDATNVLFLCDSNDHALSSDDNFTLIQDKIIIASQRRT